MEKECTLSTGKLPLGGLPRNYVVRITDRLDMTSAVHCGCKATHQTKQNKRQASTNSADPDQTAPRGAVGSGSTRFAIPSAVLVLISLWKYIFV